MIWSNPDNPYPIDSELKRNCPDTLSLLNPKLPVAYLLLAYKAILIRNAKGIPFCGCKKMSREVYIVIKQNYVLIEW